MLKSVERRCKKDKEYAKLYSEQMEDMITRKAARKVTEEELRQYKGPKYYIAHHAVSKPESKSTPLRIVFNSSQKFQGLSLNCYLAKGPSLMNLIQGVLLRFRERKYAYAGDIAKMFHSIGIVLEDQMTHLFLWKDPNSNEEPSTYAMTVVNFGDRPSATIAQAALRGSAERERHQHQEACNIILNNSYVDDILGSTDELEKRKEITETIEKVLNKYNFHIKEWVVSGETENVNKTNNESKDGQQVDKRSEESKQPSDEEKILGMKWNKQTDTIAIVLKGFVEITLDITKRIVLACVHSLYDLMGLISPFTVKLKILLRKIWAVVPKLDWDDSIPEWLKDDWEKAHQEMKQIPNVSFPRSLSPHDKVGMPSLVVFSDASTEAYGAVSYIRWDVNE